MENKPLRTSNDEIDLLYYFQKLREGLDKGGGLYFRSLRENLFLFLSIVILITGAAFALRYIIPPAYSTNSLYVSHYLPANYYAAMVNDLDQILDKKNATIVAEQLNLTPAVVSTIQEIKLKPLRDTLLDKNDTIFSPFMINLLLKNMSYLDSIESGILLYLHGGKDEYYKNLVKANLLRQAQDKLYLKLIETDTAAAAANSRRIYEEIIKTEQMVKEVQKIVVVRPFLKRVDSNYPNFRNYLIFGFLLSLLLALIITPLVGRKKVQTP